MKSQHAGMPTAVAGIDDDVLGLIDPTNRVRNITSSLEFAAAIHDKLYEKGAFNNIESVTAAKIREVLLRAIRCNLTFDYTASDLIANFGGQIAFVWRCLVASPSREPLDFRSNFRDLKGRDPVNVTEIHRGKERLEDAELLCRIVEKVTGPGVLATVLRKEVYAEDDLIKLRFRMFIESVYPKFLKNNRILPGCNYRIYYAGGFARVHVKQGGPEGRTVWLYFTWKRQKRSPFAPPVAPLTPEEAAKGQVPFWRRWRVPLVPTKQIRFTGDAADRHAVYFDFDRESVTMTCSEVLRIMEALIKKHGDYLPADFESIEIQMLRERKYRTGITPNPNVQELRLH